MNKILKYIVFSTLGFIVASCSQFNEIKDVKVVEPLKVKVKINTNVASGIPTPSEYNVSFKNFDENIEIVKKITSTEAEISDLIPGTYSITVSGESVTPEFTYNFNGNLVNISVVDEGKELKVDVGASKSGNIVFKELFYCGSKTPKGGSYFRDQYYELYNNSSSVQYLDGLCIGNMAPLTATANLPVWELENPDDYVYFLTIWQIPGEPNVTKNYPLQPGECVIVAQMADNHQKENLNPTSPVNLLSAEFEALVGTTSLILDNPAVNLNMAFWPRPTLQWLVTVFGGAYAIFYQQSPIDPDDYIAPKGSTSKHYKVPVDDIVDAVELVNDETKMKLKRVPATLDAGASTVGATYCTKSVARKIKERLPDGRVILMDSNNSTNDFEVMDPPVIRRYGAKIPAWNTWAE